MCKEFPKIEVGESDVSISFADCPPIRLKSIQVVVPSRKPVTAAEIQKARAKLKNIFRKELPLEDGRCVVPIGENIAEVITENPKPLSKVQFEEVFRHMNNLLTLFPEKITKAGIAEDYVE